MMKWIITALACLPLVAQAAHVTFDYRNSALEYQRTRLLELVPIYVYDTNNVLVTADRIKRPTGATGVAVISNLLQGTYRGEFIGAYSTTTNWFIFPNTNGAINAWTYRTNSAFGALPTNTTWVSYTDLLTTSNALYSADAGRTNWSVASVTNAGTAAYSNANAFVLSSAIGTAAYSNAAAFMLADRFGANVTAAGYSLSNATSFHGTNLYVVHGAAIGTNGTFTVDDSGAVGATSLQLSGATYPLYANVPVVDDANAGFLISWPDTRVSKTWNGHNLTNLTALYITNTAQKAVYVSDVGDVYVPYGVMHFGSNSMSLTNAASGTTFAESTTNVFTMQTNKVQLHVPIYGNAVGLTNLQYTWHANITNWVDATTFTQYFSNLVSGAYSSVDTNFNSVKSGTITASGFVGIGAGFTSDANIALWGDSLTLGMGQYLSAAMTTNTIWNEGVGGDTAAEILARCAAETNKHGFKSVIWAGSNDLTNYTDVVANVALIVAELTHTNYVVLSVLINTNYPIGTVAWTNAVNLNAALAAAYPTHYLDVRDTLTGAAADGLIPGTHRADAIHLNAAGYTVVANCIAEYAMTNGWTTYAKVSGPIAFQDRDTQILFDTGTGYGGGLEAQMFVPYGRSMLIGGDSTCSGVPFLRLAQASGNFWIETFAATKTAPVPTQLVIGTGTSGELTIATNHSITMSGDVAVNGTLTSATMVTTNDATFKGSIDLGTYKNIGTTVGGSRRYLCLWDGSGFINLWNEGSSSILFGTDNTERMRIAPTGNVGIGAAATPLNLLSVPGEMGLWYLTLTNRAPYGVVHTSTNSASLWNSNSVLHWVDSVSTNQLLLVRPNGNVGIGTTTPTNALLEVNGSGAFQTLYVQAPTNVMTGINGYPTAMTNIAPVLTPVGRFGYIAFQGSAAVDMAEANVYTNLSEGGLTFTRILTNGFTGSTTTGSLTNAVAGYYGVAFGAVIANDAGLNGDEVELEVFVGGIAEEHLASSVTGAATGYSRVNGNGVVYLPAGTRVELKVKNESAADDVTFARAYLRIGTP